MNEAVARGDFKTSYERIRETNPLLGVTARCCPQLQGLCEDACVLKWSGQPIGIGLIQRYVADWERKHRQDQVPISIAQDTGKKVAVIGAGPAGLAGAALLRRYGHQVTIYEASSKAGGTAWYGVPDYHLPKDVLLDEIENIKKNGVTKEQLARAKALIAGNHYHSLETVDGLAHDAAYYEALGDWKRSLSYLPSIQKVSPRRRPSSRGRLRIC